MKKIIAAALSVLIGSLGLTVVDKTIESRVATLESEVVELREEVSNYHTTNVYETIPTDQEPSTEDLSIDFSETSCPEETEEPSSGFFVGDYLFESTNSTRKFLIREYYDGTYKYIPSYSYEPVSFVQNPTTTVSITETTPFSSPNGQTPDDPEASTEYLPRTTNEYFLYLTDVTAQWTESKEEYSYSYHYDKDYSQVSQRHTTENNYIVVKYKGYTDPNLSGTKINFVVNNYHWEQISISNNVIDENGYFDFEVVYCSHYTPWELCINSIIVTAP